MKPRTFAVTLVSIAIAGAAAVLHTALRGPDPIRTVHIGAAVAERAADAGVAIGPADAAIVVRVFSDFQCPACRRLDAEAGVVLRRWAADGLIRYVHIHAPSPHTAAAPPQPRPPTAPHEPAGRGTCTACSPTASRSGPRASRRSRGS